MALLICGLYTLGEDSARELAVVDAKGMKLVDSPAKTKKSDFPLTISDSKLILSIIFTIILLLFVAYSLGKDSAGPVVVDTEETKPMDSPAKTKKSDVPLTMSL